MSTFEETVDKAIEVAVSRALSRAYPIGSIYLTLTDSNPSTLFGGTWEKVGSGKCLWLADSSHGAGTTISAGLPNITGSTASFYAYWGSTSQGTTLYNGAFHTYVGGGGVNTGSGGTTGCAASQFNASWSNSIYGSSDTVQPPAYVVIAWKRTA